MTLRGSENDLKTFQDNEKTIPAILTTSRKLSTGVDARNVRNIVLMRPFNNMIEFKQIIGRGTPLYDGKDYFTAYDFLKAHYNFADPEWDGEPLPPEVCERFGPPPCTCKKGGGNDGEGLCTVCGQKPCVYEKPEPEVRTGGLAVQIPIQIKSLADKPTSTIVTVIDPKTAKDQESAPWVSIEVAQRIHRSFLL